MTQIKQGFSRSPHFTYVVTTSEDNVQSKDKSPSPELLSLIKAAVSSLIAFGELWESIKHKGIDEGFQEQDLQDMLRPLLRDRLGMSKDKIYYLFHKEEQKERVKTSQDNRKKTKFLDKKEPEQRSTSERPPDAEEFIGSPEQEIQKIGEIRRALAKQDAEEDDAQDLEIQFLKERVAELEDALKKTQQFKPATALQEPEAVDVYRRLTDDNLFKVLSERDNGVSCYWYDGYGIELFKTRILTQLKGKGVTTFKRLYFEV